MKFISNVETNKLNTNIITNNGETAKNGLKFNAAEGIMVSSTLHKTHPEWEPIITYEYIRNNTTAEHFHYNYKYNYLYYVNPEVKPYFSEITNYSIENSQFFNFRENTTKYIYYKNPEFIISNSYVYGQVNHECFVEKESPSLETTEYKNVLIYQYSYKERPDINVYKGEFSQIKNPSIKTFEKTGTKYAKILNVDGKKYVYYGIPETALRQYISNVSVKYFTETEKISLYKIIDESEYKYYIYDPELTEILNYNKLVDVKYPNYNVDNIFEKTDETYTYNIINGYSKYQYKLFQDANYFTYGTPQLYKITGTRKQSEFTYIQTEIDYISCVSIDDKIGESNFYEYTGLTEEEYYEIYTGELTYSVPTTYEVYFNDYTGELFRKIQSPTEIYVTVSKPTQYNYDSAVFDEDFNVNTVFGTLYKQKTDSGDSEIIKLGINTEFKYTEFDSASLKYDTDSLFYKFKEYTESTTYEFKDTEILYNEYDISKAKIELTRDIIAINSRKYTYVYKPEAKTEKIEIFDYFRINTIPDVYKFTTEIIEHYSIPKYEQTNIEDGLFKITGEEIKNRYEYIVSKNNHKITTTTTVPFAYTEKDIVSLNSPLFIKDSSSNSAYYLNVPGWQRFFKTTSGAQASINEDPANIDVNSGELYALNNSNIGGSVWPGSTVWSELKVVKPRSEIIKSLVTKTELIKFSDIAQLVKINIKGDDELCNKFEISGISDLPGMGESRDYYFYIVSYGYVVNNSTSGSENYICVTEISPSEQYSEITVGGDNLLISDNYEYFDEDLMFDIDLISVTEPYIKSETSEFVMVQPFSASVDKIYKFTETETEDGRSVDSYLDINDTDNLSIFLFAETGQSYGSYTETVQGQPKTEIEIIEKYDSYGNLANIIEGCNSISSLAVVESAYTQATLNDVKNAVKLDGQDVTVNKQVQIEYCVTDVYTGNLCVGTVPTEKYNPSQNFFTISTESDGNELTELIDFKYKKYDILSTEEFNSIVSDHVIPVLTEIEFNYRGCTEFYMNCVYSYTPYYTGELISGSDNVPESDTFYKHIIPYTGQSIKFYEIEKITYSEMLFDKISDVENEFTIDVKTKDSVFNYKKYTEIYTEKNTGEYVEVGEDEIKNAVKSLIKITEQSFEYNAAVRELASEQDQVIYTEVDLKQLENNIVVDHNYINDTLTYETARLTQRNIPKYEKASNSKIAEYIKENDFIITETESLTYEKAVYQKEVEIKEYSDNPVDTNEILNELNIKVETNTEIIEIEDYKTENHIEYVYNKLDSIALSEMFNVDIITEICDFVYNTVNSDPITVKNYTEYSLGISVSIQTEKEIKSEILKLYKEVSTEVDNVIESEIEIEEYSCVYTEFDVSEFYNIKQVLVNTYTGLYEFDKVTDSTEFYILNTITHDSDNPAIIKTYEKETVSIPYTVNISQFGYVSEVMYEVPYEYPIFTQYGDSLYTPSGTSKIMTGVKIKTGNTEYCVDINWATEGE